MIHLAKMPQLSFLYLDGLPLTDAGLEHLKPLQNLDRLVLNGTRITDEGMRHIGELTKLERLEVGNTAVSFAFGVPGSKLFAERQRLAASVLAIRSQFFER